MAVGTCNYEGPLDTVAKPEALSGSMISDSFTYMYSSLAVECDIDAGINRRLQPG